MRSVWRKALPRRLASVDEPAAEPPAEGVPGIDGVDLFMRSHDWPPYPGSRGQCMDCGFLSRRSADPRIFSVEEVSIEQRKAGDLFALKFSAGPSMPW